MAISSQDSSTRVVDNDGKQIDHGKDIRLLMFHCYGEISNEVVVV
jgi:hypothetical protein